MSDSRRTLVLFDFDGTITRKDTLFAIIHFICGRRKFYSGMIVLFPRLCLYMIRAISNVKMKEWLLCHFFGGMTYDLFQARCEAFAHDRIPGLIRRDALAEIKKWQERKADIVVVTASAENWVAPWCRLENIACIGTRLQLRDCLITGRITGKNCNGEEKVRRIKSSLNLSVYDKIVAYGDTKNDLPMLNLATESHFKIFRQ